MPLGGIAAIGPFLAVINQIAVYLLIGGYGSAARGRLYTLSRLRIVERPTRRPADAIAVLR
ncbi:MAG: hypothetical protein MZV65_34700 [Chromatiales bacterium]|nr:hypothetical protein [Chromatiales bacterium]